MPTAASSIEQHPDRDAIDDDVRAMGTPGGSTYKQVAGRWGLSIGTVQRRKRALDRVDQQNLQPVARDLQIEDRPAPQARSRPAPTPAHALAPPAPEPTIAAQAGLAEPVANLSDDPDTDEIAGNDGHLWRLKALLLMKARLTKNTDLARVFGKSLATIERWHAQAKADKRAALATFDILDHVGDATQMTILARAQHLLNAQRCLETGDLAGHRLAVAAAVQADNARVGHIKSMLEMGVITPPAKKLEVSDTVKALTGNAIKEAFGPLFDAMHARARARAIQGNEPAAPDTNTPEIAHDKTA